MVSICFSFFFNDTATTEIYTLSLHDALPIYVFYVTDTDGGKIADDERINFVKTQLEATIQEFEREGHRLFAS